MSTPFSGGLSPNSASSADYYDFGGLTELRRDVRSGDDASIEQVAKQFESVFIQMMLKSMRATVPKDGLFSSHQMETYTNMADQQIALSLSQRGGLGLAEMIKRQLLEIQGGGRANSGGDAAHSDELPVTESVQ